jgi:hypothetical protein
MSSMKEAIFDSLLRSLFAILLVAGSCVWLGDFYTEMARTFPWYVPGDGETHSTLPQIEPPKGDIQLKLSPQE